MNETGIGALLGAIVGLVLSVIFVKICNKNGKFKNEYDERQEAIRGRGYKYAAYSTWIMLAICIIADLSNVNLHMDEATKLFTIIFIAIMIAVSYFIWKDAYFASNNNVRKYVVLFVIITLVNVIVAAMGFAENKMIIDGVLTYRSINLECSLIFAIIGIQYVIKSLMYKADDQED